MKTPSDQYFDMLKRRVMYINWGGLVFFFLLCPAIVCLFINPIYGIPIGAIIALALQWKLCDFVDHLVKKEKWPFGAWAPPALDQRSP